MLHRCARSAQGVLIGSAFEIRARSSSRSIKLHLLLGSFPPRAWRQHFLQRPGFGLVQSLVIRAALPVVGSVPLVDFFLYAFAGIATGKLGQALQKGIGNTSASSTTAGHGVFSGTWKTLGAGVFSQRGRLLLFALVLAMWLARSLREPLLFTWHRSEAPVSALLSLTREPTGQS